MNYEIIKLTEKPLNAYRAKYTVTYMDYNYDGYTEHRHKKLHEADDIIIAKDMEQVVTYINNKTNLKKINSVELIKDVGAILI